jgi:penicillin-binding protein 2
MRERLYLLLLILGFGILITRLFVLQVVQGAYWREIAEGNRIKVSKIPALRGVIYDRNGVQLVRNTPEGREYVYKEVLAQVLGYIGEVSSEELEVVEGARDRFSENLLRDSVFRIDHNQTYPNANVSSKDHFAPLYQLGDLIGKMGIEKQYDQLLRGQPGGILEEVDATGSRVRQLGETKAKPGDSLNLTIDIGLQEKAHKALEGKKGAVVAIVPQTGEVLALVSHPTFDPNIFTLKKTEEILKILSDKNQPMFNRAISGQYPPGSTFKIVTAIAGLEEGKVNPETTVEDKGVLNFGKWSFSNWYFNQYGRTEGLVDIVKAIKRSNDIFFYKVGEWLGIDNLSRWARTFGLGRLSGIDLPGEEAGLVPDKDWKKEYKKEDWYLGDDFITAIGQGDLLATPLQINLITSVIANGGKWCRPYLRQNGKIENQNFNLKLKNNNCKDLDIKKENLELVKEGMREACETGGTGWPFFKFKIKNEELEIDERNYYPPTASDSADIRYVPVGCKTGTAEAHEEKAKPHAWFTVFAPFNEPEIVLTVLLENAGEGSSEAGPIAKEILKWWLEKKDR